MITRNVIIFFIISGCFLDMQADGCSTSVDGWTFPYDANDDMLIPGLETNDECAALCQSTEYCAGYTFQPSQPLNFCFHFKSLTSMMIPCSGACTTGSITKIQEGNECQEHESDHITDMEVEDVEECLNKCSEEEECQHFLYFNEDALFPKTCFLYSTICNSTGNNTSTMEWCNCQSGNLNCLNPPITTPTSTTPAPTTTLPTPMECLEFLVLDDASRNNEHGYEKYSDNSGNSHTSPDWQGEAWYRLMDDAGNFIPEASPGDDHCGTSDPGYLITTHPTEVYETATGTVCFDATDYNGNDCFKPREIQITRCQDFFVYYLKETEYYSRYCGTFNL